MRNVQSHPIFLTPRSLQPEYPLFVFLPGMDGTGQLLQVQTVGLEAAFDIRCLAIPPDDLTDWDGLTKRVVALIETELHQSGDRPVYLCGESFGGCLAMKVATYAPHLFDRMILVNPASSFHRRPLIGWGSQITRWLPDPLYRLSSALLIPFLADLSRITPRDRQTFYDAVQSVPQETSIWRLSLLSQFKITLAELQQIQQSVLILASTYDQLFPSLVEAKHLAQSLPNAQVITLPYSGHACLLEADINLYEIMKAANFLHT